MACMPARDVDRESFTALGNVGVRPLVGLSPLQRLKAATEMVDQMTAILEAVERGEIDASTSETARLQGAVVALRTIAG